MKGKVLVTGSQGFIGAYICDELLDRGYYVTGVDNFSKYGFVERNHNFHPNFELVNVDATKLDCFEMADREFDHIIAGAAKIGGISYFHKYPYDLIAENERIIASTFDYAISRENKPRVTVISSSMVFENAERFPTPEDEVEFCPPPDSAYGFQKLATEYLAKAAFDQYGIDFTIIRPSNCVGAGEFKAASDEARIGNESLMLSHVLPDFVKRAIQSNPDDEMMILGSGDQIRCYTNGKDIARGIRMAMESEKALCDDFNISIAKSHTVKELATIVWNEVHGCDPKFRHEPAFLYDVQKRIPNTQKAKRELGFVAEITLEESVKEVVEWMKQQMSQAA